MKRVLIAAIVLALLPSLYALRTRVTAEHPGPVVLTLDEMSARDEAAIRGVDLDELLDHYRDLGARGLGVYEMRVEDWVARGKAVYSDGNTLRLFQPSAGFQAGWYYLSPTSQSDLEKISRALTLPQQRVAWFGRVWIGFPKDVSSEPIGADANFILERYRKGNFIVYRPRNSLLRRWPPPLPEPVQAYVFAGNEVLGFPDHLSDLPRLLRAPVGVIEGAKQDGVKNVAAVTPVLRTFSLQKEWQLKLSPDAAAQKYLLAARERGQQILYFRLWPDPQKSERFLHLLTSGLKTSGIALGDPSPRNLRLPPYKYSAWLGVLAGLVLLALSYPQPLGASISAALLLGALLYSGISGAGPLLAAIVFASLGFAQYKRGFRAWLAALAYALTGAVFLTALGSNTATISGLRPFKGVFLTLALPPLLVMLAQAPQEKSLKETLLALWDHRIRIGEALLAFLALIALAVVMLRRGNSDFVSGMELHLRALLQDWMVRPRFKEIFGHASAVVGLTQPWPNWIRVGLLAFAALADASILNSFSHYHTPLFVSLARTINGAVVGLLCGAVLAGSIWVIRKWWSR